MVVDRGVLKVFREGICLVISFWWQIRRKDVGYRHLHLLRRCLFDWFIQFKDPPSVPSATMKLEHLLNLCGIDIIYVDNSLEEVSEQLVVMYGECLQGDFSSVEIIKEANYRLARELIRPNVVKANSSEVDASHVFRQGIGLLMENLWVHHVFIHHLCHSNPHPMLQVLADDILFWVNQDKGMSERIGVAPLAADVPVVSEKTREQRNKIRVERQKERERERRLDDKDAAMGKKRNITTDRVHDISEEVDLGKASTNEQGKMVVYDERLFSQDTGSSVFWIHAQSD